MVREIFRWGAYLAWLVCSAAQAATPVDSDQSARRNLEAARESYRRNDLDRAEAQLLPVLVAVDRDRVQDPSIRAECLGLLTQALFRRAKYADALRVGRRYYQLVRDVPTRAHVTDRLACEVAVQLARSCLHVADFGLGERILRDVPLSETVRTGWPALALDISACRAELAVRLAGSAEDPDMRGHWADVARKRWQQVERTVERLSVEIIGNGLPIYRMSTFVPVLTELAAGPRCGDSAVRVLEELADRFEQRRYGAEAAWAWTEVAGIHRERSDHGRAWKCLLRAATLRDRSRPVSVMEFQCAVDLAQVAVVVQRTRLSGKKGDDPADRHLTRSADVLAELIDDLHRHQRYGHAMTLRFLLATVCDAGGRYPQAIRQMERFLAECGKQRGNIPPDLPWRARFILGGLFERTGDLRKAHQYFDAVVVHRQRAMSDKTRRGIRPLIDLAESLDQLGTALTAQGKYNQGIKNYHGAIKIFKQALACRTDVPPDKEQVMRARLGLYGACLDLAVAYKSQGARRSAITICLDLRRLLEESGDSAHVRLMLAKCYNALADSHIGEGNWDDAERYAGKSAAIDPGNPTVRHHLAVIDLAKGNVDEAQAAFEKLLERHERNGDRLWQGLTLRRLGDICRERYTCSGNRRYLNRAGEFYHDSMTYLDTAGALPVARFNARVGLAVTLHDEGNAEDAIRHLKEASTIIEAAGACTTGAERHRAAFFAQFADANDLLVEWLLQKQAAVDALFHAEKFRNRTLGDELELFGVDLVGTLSTADRDRLVPAMEALKRDREMLLAGIGTRGPDAGEALRTLEEKIRVTWNDLRDASPIYRRLLGNPRSARTFQEDLRKMRRPDQVVLYYYLGESTSYVWTIGPRQVTVRRLTIDPESVPTDGNRPVREPVPLTRPLVEQFVAGYYGLVFGRDAAARPGTEPTTRGWGPPERVADARPKVKERKAPVRPPAEPRPFGPQQAVALTEALLPDDLCRQLVKEHCRQLIIIPDGALHRIPFQALVVSHESVRRGAERKALPYRYLIDIERFPAISYAPSLRALATLQARGSHSAPTCRVLTVGGNLPGSEEECDEVVGAFPRGRVIHPLTGRRARKRLLQMYAPGSGIIHFADHAVCEKQRDNFFGHLVLHKSKLELNEIHDLELPHCEVVVLSACETNVGALRQFETGNTLARAFLVAGARRVVASFWKVNDQATVALMSKFFQAVAEAEQAGQAVDYAAALRNAMRRLRKDPRMYGPEDWAPFALIGPPAEDRPLSAEEDRVADRTAAQDRVFAVARARDH